MIQIKPIPDAYLVENKNDFGKKVIVKCGLLKNKNGIVVYGPFQNTWEIKSEIMVKGFLKKVKKSGVSIPNWYVYISDLDRYFYFAEEEILFLK